MTTLIKAIKAANELIETRRASKPQAAYDNYVEAPKRQGPT